jgi:hypothetical protein
MEGYNNTYTTSALRCTYTILMGLMLSTLTLMTPGLDHVTDVLAIPPVLAALFWAG